MNNKKMIVWNHGEKIQIEPKKDEHIQRNLMEIFQDKGIYITNSCRGNGICGKCKVRIADSNLAVTEIERKILSKNELEQGIRLACKISMADILKTDADHQLIVEVLENQEENIVVKSVEKKDISNKGKGEIINGFLAIDIGTTTIAMALVDISTGEVYDTYVSVNHQRVYGEDVLSRIVAANEGKGDRLKDCIEKDLWKGIYYFLDKYNCVEKKDAWVEEQVGICILGIVIAGNTTMMHLLRGYSCESLGKYPFVSKYLVEKELFLHECIGVGFKSVSQEVYDIPVLLMPGISAFVGSDIVAGMLACPGFDGKEISYFLDLGTNGEMVLGNRDSMIATSVAAGPAFEGGNIICGTASVPGSICREKISNRKPIIGTIGKKIPPVGICGSGLISVIAQLRKEKIIDFQGSLQQPFQKEGFSLWTFSDGEKLALYQEDIRQFQMAKSAVRSGIEILRQEYGCQLEDVKNVYVSGGFGTNLTVEDIIGSGLLPREWEGKITFLGNTSLLGSIKVGIMRYGTKGKESVSFEVKLRRVLEKMKTVSLAKDEEFKRLYIENIDFV